CGTSKSVPSPQVPNLPRAVVAPTLVGTSPQPRTTISWPPRAPGALADRCRHGSGRGNETSMSRVHPANHEDAPAGSDPHSRRARSVATAATPGARSGSARLAAHAINAPVSHALEGSAVITGTEGS